MEGPGDTRRVSDCPETVHATTVAIGARALLIRGPSGAGKSALALQLMALGAQLVADDRTCLAASTEGLPVASAPDTIRGMIEARGVGILKVDPAPPTRVVAVLDLGATETERIPEPRSTRVAGVDLPLLHKVESEHFPAALMQYMLGGRCQI